MPASLPTEYTWPFLTRGGEMGDLIRQKDWTTTPLGHPETWSPTLRTSLSIVVNNKMPMYLFWGPELISFYNDSFRQSLGTDGKHPSALGSPGPLVWAETWAFNKPFIDQVLNKKEAVWIEDRFVPFYRNGQLEDSYWTVSYSPVEDEAGTVAGIIVSCYETTQKWNNYQELRASEQRFRNLIRDADFGIVILSGHEMVVQHANEAYGRLIKRSPHELFGKPLFNLIPDASEPFNALLQQVLNTGEPVFLYAHPYAVQTRHKKIEGFLDIVYQPYREADGKITGVVALCHDVTEIVRSRQALEEAQLKHKIAVSSANLGTYELDMKSRAVITSPRFNEIWGTTYLDSHADIISRLHPEDHNIRLKAHEIALFSGHLTYEARVIRPDSSIHWVRVNGTFSFDADKQPRVLAGVVQDISEQKRLSLLLHEQVENRTRELRRSNDDLQQFGHVISHDLKEPLRKISLYSDLVRREFNGNAPGRVDFFTEKIESASRRMSAMVEGVLAYSSLSDTHEMLQMVDLNTIMTQVVDDLEVHIQQKSAQVKWKDLPTIQGAAILLQQLFYNIVNNSLKFSKPNIAPIIIIGHTSLIEESFNAVQITIQDNGIGFEQIYAERIFTTFTRLHSKDRFEGTGLGLALCKKIVERHHGVISAESIPGQGATIILTLPVIQPA